jgi:hypothetical protein
MNTQTFLHGIITVTLEGPTRWVARLENGLWMDSSWSATDAVGRLIRQYPNATIEYARRLDKS